MLTALVNGRTIPGSRELTPDIIQKNLVRWFQALDVKLSPVFLVGGAVRDFLLERHSNDLDLACREAAGFARRLADRHDAAFVHFEKKPGQACFRVIERQHPENFIDLVELYGGDILKDLNRRDFTINAMAMPIREGGRLGGLVDPHNGLSDLKGRIIRMVRPQAFSDDPLRVLRAWRFAAELGCRIDDATRTHMAFHAHQLGSVAVERIVYELFQVLTTHDAAKWVRDMAGLAVLDVLFSEKGGRNGNDCHQRSWCDALAVLEGVETALRSAYTRYKSAAGQVLDYFGKDNRLPLLKLAALLHAVAWTDRADASRIADGIGRRLKLSKRDRGYLTGLLAALEDVFNIAADDSGRSARVRFFRSRADAGVGALVLGDGVLGADFDMAPLGLDRRAGSQRLSQTIVDYYTSIRARLAERDLIGGTDLINGGIPPGPLLGKILREVRHAQDEGAITNREQALRLAQKLSGR